MAKAVMTEVVKTVTVPGVALTLTEGEARTLIAVLARVAGSPSLSPRQHADDVRDALIDALAVDYTDVLEYQLIEDKYMRGSITFSDY